MRGKPLGDARFEKLVILAVVISALALLMVPALVSGAPQSQDPVVPTPEAENRVESPFRSQIVPRSGRTAGGAQAGFSPQGGQMAAQTNFTPWIMACCFVLIVLAVVWVVVFWLLGRRKAKPTSEPSPPQPTPPPAGKPPVEPPKPAATAEPVQEAPPVPAPAVPTEPGPAAPLPHAPAAQAVPSGVSLTMKKGPQPGWRYAITQSPVSIGSAPESDMVVADPQVSARHAMIWREREYYYIQEVSTEYGTFVNGERLTKARLLRDGDEIGLGPVVVLVFQSTS